MTNTGFQAWAAAGQERIEAFLQQVLPQPDIAPQRLHAAMRYAVLGAGKRVRPLLAYAAGELSRADPERTTVAGAAVEIIHAYSLVHDDLPSMDDDVLRRGKPTCHVEFDEATALLVGDALQSLAFQLLGEYRLTDDAGAQLEIVKLLARAAGSRGMAGGQAIDLAAVGKTLSVPELEFMHIHKTGALIRAAAVLGARCGNGLSEAEFARVDAFAKAVGLAFQVVDDVLDADAPTATLGKTAGKDAEQGKPTYVSAMGIAQAKALAAELREDALQAIAPFGQRGARLAQLADFIVLRKF
ncbi:MAG: polyprenyl synthetase family protein [Betaproteobacteria bacterium]|nr:polyprenyl synthetase family protein [Betaproteobacteria bacterium]MDH4293904.1 polyprenyl synthetase family protein [Betaproteobacteria bacterium]MDH5342252.1 polyprenyl synthetase family protein [Betaproteobacteria bacterium]